MPACRRCSSRMLHRYGVGVTAAIVASVALHSGAQAQSATQTVTASRVTITEFQLRDFMQQPFSPIEATRQAIVTGEFDITLETQTRRWFTHQIRQHLQIGTGFMIYAGLESGVFSGVMIDDAGEVLYTERKAGLSNPAQFDWSSVVASPGDAFETSTCARGISCRPAAPSHGCSLPSCRGGNGGTCQLNAACTTEQKVGDVWKAQAGAYLSRNCSFIGVIGNESTASGRAMAVAQAALDCGSSAACFNQSGDPAGSCLDNNIRMYYATDIHRHSEASTNTFNFEYNLSRWRQYDPRVRPWYVDAKTLAASTSITSSWSSLYRFATSNSFGLTAVHAVVEPSPSNKLVGVLAVDYNLLTVTKWLREQLGQFAASSTYYIVDLETGILISQSCSEVHPHKDDCDEGKGAYTGKAPDPTGPQGVCVLDYPNRLLNASALHLAEGFGSIRNWPTAYSNHTGSSNWPQPAWLQDTDPSLGSVIRQLHVVTKKLEDLRGLNWMVVAGAVETVACLESLFEEANSVHLECECKIGYFRSVVGTCLECPVGRTTSSGLSGCDLCASGYYALSAGAPCTSCTELPTILPKGVALQPEEARDLTTRCPGGKPGVSAGICPYSGLWFHNDVRSKRAEILRCETQSACQHGCNATCSNLMSGKGAAIGGFCGQGHKGFLCAECEPGYMKIQGNCIECSEVQFLPMLLHLASHLAIGLFLLHKSTKSYVSATEWAKIWYKVDTQRLGYLGRDKSLGSVEQAKLWFQELDEDNSGFLDVGELRLLLKRIGASHSKRAVSDMLKEVRRLSDREGSRFEDARSGACTGRTLHVRGVTAGADAEAQTAELFAKFGPVENVVVRQKIDSDGKDSSWAIVVMADRHSATDAATSGVQERLDPERAITVELFRDHQEHNNSNGAMGFDSMKLLGAKALNTASTMGHFIAEDEDEADSLQYSKCSEVEFITWFKHQLQHRHHVARVLELTDVHLSDQQKATNEYFEKTYLNLTADGKVHIDDFVRVQSSNSPTAGFEILVFFGQTLLLILQDVSLNSATEEITGSCLYPMTYAEDVLYKIIAPPFYVLFSIAAAIPVWNRLRNVGLLSRVWESLQSPPAIDRTHFQRACLNSFIFVYMPLTGSAINTLVCVETCHDGTEDCHNVVAFDKSIECLGKTHAICVVVSLIVLGLCCFVVPAVLQRHSRRSALIRDASLQLNAADVDKWWAELDVDTSGCLDHSELKVLLHKMGRKVDAKHLQKILRELDMDGSGTVEKEEFDEWFDNQLKTLVKTPYDCVYVTVKLESYWWFIFFLWLRTSINFLFTNGTHGDWQHWLVWLHLVMIIMLLMLVCVRPYENREDDLIALVSFLALASIAHMASVFREEEIHGVYLVMTVGLVLMPVIALAYSEITKRVKFKREAALSRGGAKAARIQAISDVKRSKLFAQLSRPKNYHHNVQADAGIKSFLDGVSSDGGVDGDVVESLANVMEDVHRAKGDIIIEKGELSSDPAKVFLYLLVSGTVEVLRTVEHCSDPRHNHFDGVVSVKRGPIDLSAVSDDDDNEDDDDDARKHPLIAEMGPGGVIGEATFVSNEPRSAYVRASSNVHLLRLSRTGLDHVRREHFLPASASASVVAADSAAASEVTTFASGSPAGKNQGKDEENDAERHPLMQLRPNLPSRQPRQQGQGSETGPGTPQRQQRVPSGMPGAAPYSPAPNNEAVLPPLRVTPTKAKLLSSSSEKWW